MLKQNSLRTLGYLLHKYKNHPIDVPTLSVRRDELSKHGGFLKLVYFDYNDMICSYHVQFASYRIMLSSLATRRLYYGCKLLFIDIDKETFDILSLPPYGSGRKQTIRDMVLKHYDVSTNTTRAKQKLNLALQEVRL